LNEVRIQLPVNANKFKKFFVIPVVGDFLSARVAPKLLIGKYNERKEKKI
jgi:hypothetical protein